ncbi:DsbA family protein [Actinotignum schaalii]|uniref:DsbA family protein n=1 Tax=Actinotignum TaxID=1653174 RepID=UPI0003FCEA62|nr:thioredoxin domain-containing protein [Actinotignum schaalii]WQN45165.1 thioredoxin domain-containing protein [Actinotignum schaalii]
MSQGTPDSVDRGQSGFQGQYGTPAAAGSDPAAPAWPPSTPPAAAGEAEQHPSSRGFWVMITVLAIIALVVFAVLLTLGSSNGRFGGSAAPHPTATATAPATPGAGAPGQDAPGQGGLNTTPGPVETRYTQLATDRGWVAGQNYIPTQPDEIRTQLQALPQLETASGQTAGDPKAPVHVTIYSDYACSFCNKLHAESVPQLLELAKKGDIYLAYVQVPIFKDTVSSDRAAAAAHAAGLQGKFWEYSSLLFDGAAAAGHDPDKAPSMFSDENLDAYATQLGLDVEAFRAARDSTETTSFIAAQESLGLETLGLRGTPAIIINGTASTGYQPLTAITNTIELEKALVNAAG